MKFVVQKININGPVKEVSFVFSHFLLTFACVKSFDSVTQEPTLLGQMGTIHAIGPLHREGMGRAGRYPRMFIVVSKDAYL